MTAWKLKGRKTRYVVSRPLEHHFCIVYSEMISIIYVLTFKSRHKFQALCVDQLLHNEDVIDNSLNVVNDALREQILLISSIPKGTVRKGNLQCATRSHLPCRRSSLNKRCSQNASRYWTRLILSFSHFRIVFFAFSCFPVYMVHRHEKRSAEKQPPYFKYAKWYSAKR